ncbi:MAG: trimeric intracellular cation channel family protein [Rhodospirillales bacterium]
MATIDHIAVGVFAITGALVASRKQMDIFGFILLGTVTGIGGGTIRDLLLGQQPVNWVQDPSYVIGCIIAASVTFFAAHMFQSRYQVLLWLDAIGLSLFCVLGAERALEVGTHPLVAIIMGVISGTFGGIIRDVLGGEVSLVLKKEIYVTAALLGAATFVGLQIAGVAQTLSFAIGLLTCFSVRALALRFSWSLPTYKSRPGR